MNKLLSLICVGGYMMSIGAVIIAVIMSFFNPASAITVFMFAVGGGWFCMIPPVIIGIFQGVDNYNETR